MTTKTKRNLAVSGVTVFGAALTTLIAARFAPEPESAAATAEPSVISSVSPAINAEIHEQIKPTETESKSTVSAPL